MLFRASGYCLRARIIIILILASSLAHSYLNELAITVMIFKPLLWRVVACDYVISDGQHRRVLSCASGSSALCTTVTGTGLLWEFPSFSLLERPPHVAHGFFQEKTREPTFFVS